MKVIILRGASGSGKSTWIQNNFPGAEIRSYSHLFPSKYDTWVVSADHFHTDSDGKYNFKVEAQGQAHGDCLRIFIESIRTGIRTLIVDNTNSSIAELAPYVAVSLAYGENPTIVTMSTSLEECIGRQQHGCPAASIEWQHRLSSEQIQYFPTWWIHRWDHDYKGE